MEEGRTRRQHHHHHHTSKQEVLKMLCDAVCSDKGGVITYFPCRCVGKDVPEPPDGPKPPPPISEPGGPVDYPGPWGPIIT